MKFQFSQKVRYKWIIFNIFEKSNREIPTFSDPRVSIVPQNAMIFREGACTCTLAPSNLPALNDEVSEASENCFFFNWRAFSSNYRDTYNTLVQQRHYKLFLNPLGNHVEAYSILYLDCLK